MNDQPNDDVPENNTQKSNASDNQRNSDVTNNTSQKQSDRNLNNSNSNAQKKSKLKKIITILVVLILLGLIVFGLWKSYQPKTISIQGRVEADTIHVSSKVPSRIEQLFVHEGEQVKQGQALIKLSSPEVEAKKQQALASLQSALALQSTAERGSQQENIDTLYANWQSVKAQAALAETTYQRGQTLYQQGVISRQRRDQMHAAKISANELAEASYQQYARAERGSTSQQKSSADAQVEIARAAVSEANAMEAETLLHAPQDSTVSEIYGETSELVVMGVPIISLLTDDYWVSLNVREDQYANVYKKKSLEGYIPALDQKATFLIKTIDAEGDFATIKTTRQTGGYDIRSFKLHLEPEQKIPDLKVGMSVIFEVEGQ
ncbi:biotin/lipoyl-binding protein [Acinetobacter sp. A3.8]|uniref:Biotin/lipoyl-binding protein n=1 Tax=Acinetobacter sedimenti TaxID=2919922 RepID=A0A9X1WYT1_9GAMM|nr:biotin/lipoyl-binding protein [Acinetobacter sedimenti]MCJ8146342.1 biotin/lipoyl-binding protein [Acinetobacter sedimenti]